MIWLNNGNAIIELKGKCHGRLPWHFFKLKFFSVEKVINYFIMKVRLIEAIIYNSVDGIAYI